MKKSLLFLMMLLCTVASKAVTITEVGGWFESGYVTWEKTSGLEYNVYVSPASYDSWTKLDDELVREYPTYGRADALGLTAGSYKFKVVPVSNGEEVAGDAAISSSFEVKAHDRSGFAHKQAGSEGIGAYNNDGTLKSNARVVYVWANNAKTVSLDVATNSNGKTATYTGLQQIICGYQKGSSGAAYETRPLCIRIIGTIKDTDMDKFLSSTEGIQIKGANSYQKMNITIEGVGNDANIWGFGFLIRNCSRVELRNFGIMWCMDDAVSIDTDNSMIWVHNLDLFYGQPGSDADQAKGDGTIDMKGDSQYLTIAYNHLYDSGKASLCGMKSESGPNWITYHHNWFDHSDSRHPRIRTMSVHVYNNYFDGNAKYGVGAAYQSNAFVENNYFRNCKYPMLMSMQGSDMDGGKGTFSSEDGGVIKSFGNYIKGAKKVVTYQQDNTEFDCYEATTRNEEVPASVKAKQGGKTYTNFDTDASIMYDYTPDAATDIPTIVRGTYGAGRMQHGDFKWTFDNSVQDANYEVIEALKSAIQGYTSTLVGFFDGEEISNGGATATVNGGDGKGISEATNDAAEPSWGSGGGGSSSSTASAGKYVIGTKEDYFWFNEENATAFEGYVTAGNFILGDATFDATREITNSKVGSCSDYIGSVLIPAGKTFTVYYADGIVGLAFYVSSNGSQSWKLEKSADGTNWQDAGTVTGSTGGHPACVVTATNDEGIKYVRITNNASGGRDVQGIKVATFDPDADPDEDAGEDEPADIRSSDATAEFTLNGEDIAMSGNAYTLNVAYNADDTDGYTVVITPNDENATIAAVTGATASGDTYIIAAPAAGSTSTATFRILAENKANTKTYTINIVKGVDPSTLPVTTGEFTYFPSGSTTYNSFYTISGNTTNSYGSTTYVHNGESMNCNYALKMESKTTIKFIPTQDGVVKIGLSTSGNNNLKINNTKITGNDNNIVEQEVTAGTEYAITKADVAYIFYIDLVYGESGGQGGGDDPQPSDETIFSTTATTALKVGALTTVEITSANATTTGGKIYAVNNFTDSSNPNGAEKDMIKKNTNAMGFQITNHTTPFKIVLDKALQNGDVISAKGVSNSGGERGIWVCTTETRPTVAEGQTYPAALKIAQASSAAWGDLTSYTVTADDGLAGATTIYIHRHTSNSTYFNNLKITRPAATGISTINAVTVKTDDTLYDLMGRQVTEPVRGQLYIQNGRKFIYR